MSPLPCPQCQEPAAFSKKRGCYYCAECELAFEGEAGAGAAGATPAAPAVRALKLFLSYGRDGYVSEVRALRDALRARGHEVWFDEEQLGIGLDWEMRIEKGLAWCDRVVLTMTPHSVRRPDGFCLNEIAKAMEQQKPIIPLLLAEVPEGAPTSICRIQYLDWRDAVPAAEKAERFTQRLARLCEAIEEDKLDFEGGQQRLLRHLQPLNYDGDILHHVARFHGRSRLFARLTQWLDDPAGAQRLWLTGTPGLGKSAIAATLAHRWGETGAMHFCVAGHQDKADPARAVLSIAYQLSQRLDLYRQRLGHLELEREVTKDPRALFDTLLVGPLARNFPPPQRACLVVIDALDEATLPDGSNPLAELVATQWSRLPAWLRLLVTSRPDVEVQAWLHGLPVLALSGSDPEQRADLRQHLESELQEILGPRGKAVDPDKVERILDRSEGAFHYVTLLLEDVRDGRCEPDDAVDLPAGMTGFYRQSFARRFADLAAYRAEQLPVLRLLLAAPEPVPLAILAGATARSSLEVRQQLAGLGSLVVVARAEAGWDDEWDTARLSHTSLRRWLTGVHEVTRMPVAGPHAAQPDVGALAAQVLARWDAGARHGFVCRCLWGLLKAVGDHTAMDRLAFDVSRHWQPLKLERALEPAEHAARTALAGLDGEPGLAASSAQPVTLACGRLRHLADLYLACGKSSAALQEVRRALPLAETLVAQAPADAQAQAQAEVAAVCFRIGDALQAQGDLPGALADYRKALSATQAIIDRHPHDAQAQRTLSVGLIRTGDVMQAQGDLGGALEVYRAALAIRQRLADEDPANVARQRDLLVGHNRVGAMLEAQGRLAEAQAEFAKDLSITQRLAALAPEDANWQRSLSVSHTCLGDVRQAEGDLAGALESFAQALAIREGLLRQDPTLAGAQRDLSGALHRVGEVLAAQGQVDEALGRHRMGLAIRTQLVLQDPANAGWQQDLAAAHHFVADTLALQGDLEGATAAYRACLQVLQQALASTPNSMRARHHAAIGHASLARLLLPAGRIEEARDLLATAGQMLQGASDPNSAGAIFDLAAVTALGALIDQARAGGAPSPGNEALARLPVSREGLAGHFLARRFRRAFLPLVLEHLGHNALPT